MHSEKTLFIKEDLNRSMNRILRGKKEGRLFWISEEFWRCMWHVFAFWRAWRLIADLGRSWWEQRVCLVSDNSTGQGGRSQWDGRGAWGQGVGHGHHHQRGFVGPWLDRSVTKVAFQDSDSLRELFGVDGMESSMGTRGIAVAWQTRWYSLILTDTHCLPGLVLDTEDAIETS